MSSVANIVLSHQPPSELFPVLAQWQTCVPSDSILLACGGSREAFSGIEHAQKFFVDDPRLRTRDHQRELQSYTQIFKGAAEFLATASIPFDFVYFAEYDHLPLVADLNERQIAQLEREDADILGFHVRRVDGTNDPHFLYHASDPRFARYWQEMSLRRDKETMLSMFGSGSFWNREAFLAIAAWEEPFPIYLEVYLPTLAHHLGFRVRDFGDQNRFVHNLGDRGSEIETARRDGAWTLHPVKHLQSINTK